MESFTSLAATKAALAESAPDIILTKTDSNEYRITFKLAFIDAALGIKGRPAQIEKAESLAAYETDLESAYETALAMVKNMARNLPAVEPIAAPAKPARVIDMTPTWAGILPGLLAILESGTGEGRKIAREELTRLASIADSFIAEQKSAADVVAEYPLAARGGLAAGAIVLRYLKGNPVTPFVVHFRNDDDSARAGRPAYSQGDYCADMVEARAAFADRIARADVDGSRGWDSAMESVA